MKKPRYQSLAQSTYGMNRSTGGSFSDDELAAFLLGSWTPCRSTDVKEARYVSEDGILEVIFLDSSIYQYFGISPDLAEAFGRATSKGGFVWDHLRRQGVDYVRVG